jgi:hypothetical protein
MNEDKVEYVFDQHRSRPPQVISMTQERYDAAIAEARAAEREQCCKDICYACSKGVPVFKKYGNRWWHDMIPGLKEYGCAATLIRQRAAKGL